ncbi:MAG: hypothetical protein AAFU60_01670 [Bacteroidota bacterium]
MNRALDYQSAPWPVLYIIGMISWLAFLIMSIFFYQERTLFTDAAYQLFQLIQSGEMQPPHQRFGNYLVQIFPWTALKIGASLSTILLAFSISYPIVLWAQWLILWHGFRRPDLAMVQIAGFFFMAFDSPFILQSGLYLSFGFILWVFALYLDLKTKRNQIRIWLLIILIILVANLHPLSLLVFGVAWAFFWWKEKEWPNPWYWGLLMLFIGAVWANNIYFQSAYEAQKMERTWTYLSEYVYRFWEMPAYEKFLQKCLGPFWIYPVTLSCLSVFYAWRKNVWAVLYLAGSSFVYLLFIHYSSPNTSYPFYAEIGYLPLGFLVALPLFADNVIQSKLKSLFPVLIIGLFLSKTWMIGQQSVVYAQRLQWLMTEIERSRQNRQSFTLLHRWDTPDAPVLMNWGTPYESLLLSSLGEEESVTIWITDQVGIWENPPTEKGVFRSNFEELTTENLNEKFFRLPRQAYTNRRIKLGFD